MRLSSKKQIAQLFAQGQTHFLYPFKIVYLERDSSSTPQQNLWPPPVLFSISKRNFKRAHQRNQLRRRIREAYRLNFARLMPPAETDCLPWTAWAWIYVAKKPMSFKEIEAKMLKIFDHFAGQVR